MIGISDFIVKLTTIVCIDVRCNGGEMLKIRGNVAKTRSNTGLNSPMITVQPYKVAH